MVLVEELKQSQNRTLAGLLEELTEEQVDCLNQYTSLCDIAWQCELEYFNVYENSDFYLGDFEPKTLAKMICDAMDPWLVIRGYAKYNPEDRWFRFTEEGYLYTYSDEEYDEWLEMFAEDIVEGALKYHGLM